jgi:hypothetical protein
MVACVWVALEDGLGFTALLGASWWCSGLESLAGAQKLKGHTCSPERYAGVIDAHRIELTA